MNNDQVRPSELTEILIYLEGEYNANSAKCATIRAANVALQRKIDNIKSEINAARICEDCES